MLKSIDTLLITGGTGSFGSALVARLMSRPRGPRVRIYSRDEYKQADLQRRFPASRRLTYILGDVRDPARLRLALDGCTHLVHAAALKTVPAGEQQALEFIQTNVVGSCNVVLAAIERGVRHSLLVSSDKAVAALNHYGKCKAAAEGIFVQGNILGAHSKCKFVVVRGGNVWGSRGSVVEIWRESARLGQQLNITDPDATRFFLRMADWLAFCEKSLCAAHGGEIAVPKMPAWRLGDLAAAVGGRQRIIGLRPGDKRSETLVADGELAQTVDAGWAYIIQPSLAAREALNYNPWHGKRVTRPVTSEHARRMGVVELGKLLRERE